MAEKQVHEGSEVVLRRSRAAAARPELAAYAFGFLLRITVQKGVAAFVGVIVLIPLGIAPL
jgi:hypothetical protein